MVTGDLVKIGRYRAYFEAPALLFIVLEGVVQDGENAQFMRDLENAQKVLGVRDVIVDMRMLKDMTPGARKELVHTTGPNLDRVAMYGAGYTMGQIMRMLYRAGRILRPGFFNYDFDVFSSEHQARAWLAKRPAEQRPPQRSAEQHAA